jgi:hypothetical protein
LVVNLAGLTLLEWLLLFSSWPVFLLLFLNFKSKLASEVASGLVDSYAVRLTKPVAPFFMICVFTLARHYLIGAPVSFDSIAQAKETAVIIFDPNNQDIFSYIGQWAALLGGMRDFTFGLIYDLHPIVWFIVWLMASWALFYGLSEIMCSLVIKTSEFKRLWAKPTPLQRPISATSSRLVFQALVPLMVASVVYFCGFIYLELTYQGPYGRRADQILVSVTELVMIGDEYYSADILQEAEKFRLARLDISKVTKDELNIAVDTIFDGFKNNVDGYLDWYYSLKGEFVRLGALATTELDDYLRDNLMIFLSRNVDTDVIIRIYNRFNRLAAQYSPENLKAKFKVNFPIPGAFNRKFVVIKQLSPAHFDNLINPPEFTSLKMRFTVSTISGLTGGIIAGVGARRLVNKIISKYFYQTAVKQLAKTLVSQGSSKLLGALAGAAGGAALAAPTGPGAIVGAAAGIVVGVGTAFATEWAMLKLEELVKRDDFRKTIISAIELSRMEMKNQINFLPDLTSPSSPPTPTKKLDKFS